MVAVVAVFLFVGLGAGLAANRVGSRVSRTASVAVRLPSGQWLATGLTTSVTGDIANDALGDRVVRAWDFVRSCSKQSACHTDLVRSLDDGSIERGQLVRNPHGSFFAVTFGPAPDLCALVPGHPRSKETITTVIDVGWARAGELVGDDKETITGCGGPPAIATDHWTATPVPPPPPLSITINAEHAASRPAFLASASKICTSVNAQAQPVVDAIKAAEGLVRTATSNASKARAEADIARLLGQIGPLLVRPYDEIPQPPAGSLDAAWQKDIAQQRLQLEPASAAFAALAGAASAAGSYFQTGASLDGQRAIADSVFFSEDLVAIAGSSATSTAIEEHQLHLPAICTNPPAIASLFSSVAGG